MKRIAILALLALAGCSDPQAPAAGPKMTVSGYTVWRGGLVTVRGISDAVTPAFFVDTFPAAEVFRRADSAIIRLPETAAGVLPLRRSGSPDTIALLSIMGAVGYEDLPFAPGSIPYVWRVDSVAQVVVRGLGKILKYTFATRTYVELFPGSSDYSLDYTASRTPTPTADPNVFGFVRSKFSYLDFWHFPDAVRGDSMKLGFVPREIAVMAGGAVIRTYAHGTYAFAPDGSQTYWAQEDEDSPDIVLSSDGMLAAVPSLGTPTGVPVFGADGGLKYRVARARKPYDALFSVDGQVLYVTNETGAEDRTSIGSVLKVNAATGVITDSTTLGRHIPEDLELDPSGRWLYVATGNGQLNRDGVTQSAYLYILDASTLSLVGSIPLEINSSSCTLRTAAARDGIYVICGTKIARIARP